MVVQGKWAVSWESLGHGQPFLVFTLGREVVTPSQWGNRANRIVVDAFGKPFYSSRRPTESHGWGNLLDFGNPGLRVSYIGADARERSGNIGQDHEVGE